jgi:hypothetical protein
MIKFLRKFQSFIRDDRGIVGEHGILASIAMYGMGILGLALLAFPGRMVLPDSPIASQAVSLQTRGVCTGGIEATTWISTIEALQKN